MDKDQSKEQKKEQRELQKLAEEEVKAIMKSEPIMEHEVPNLFLSNKSERMRSRYTTVAECLLKGYSPSQIAEKYHKEWNVSQDTIKKVYIRAAKDAMKEDIPADVNDLITGIWLRYEHLYKKFHDEGNYWGSKAVLDAQIRMITQGGNMETQDAGPIKIIEIQIQGNDPEEENG